ncbi:hypothetical protein ACF061_16600 [Streptomyces sp. NPDC015220]|uniref:hypothetical protein n=1 Tax=Streptomyces sp. NPDC015220 TaxID=3364947 RepID=UPI0036FFC2FE
MSSSLRPGPRRAAAEHRQRAPGGLILELFIDLRRLLDRQEEPLGKRLEVRDYAALVAAVARHRVNTPHIDVGTPDAYWRAAALLEQTVPLRPLPARSEYFGYGVAIAYVRASGGRVETAYEPWRDVITGIRALRLNVHDVADTARCVLLRRARRPDTSRCSEGALCRTAWAAVRHRPWSAWRPAFRPGHCAGRPRCDVQPGDAGADDAPPSPGAAPRPLSVLRGAAPLPSPGRVRLAVG